MDFLNLLVCYVYFLAALFVANSVWTSINAACVEVLGTSFQDLLSSAYAEVALAIHNASLKAGIAFEGIVAKGSSPRYFF